jgi:glycosyltransferase involved in cell wall biosynthesis
MVCGGGVIATRYNGHEEIINDYGNVCDVGDIQGLSEIMVDFLVDIRRRDELKRNQCRDVGSFDMTKSIKQYKKLIVEVIHG